MQKFGLGTNIWTIPFEHITIELEVFDFLKLTALLPAHKFLTLVALRRRSLLHGRRGPNTTIFPRLLPAHFPDTTIPVDLLLFNGSLGLLWYLQHICHDLPVYTCTVFLVGMDR